MKREDLIVGAQEAVAKVRKSPDSIRGMLFAEAVRTAVEDGITWEEIGISQEDWKKLILPGTKMKVHSLIRRSMLGRPIRNGLVSGMMRNHVIRDGFPLRELLEGLNPEELCSLVEDLIRGK